MSSSHAGPVINRIEGGLQKIIGISVVGKLSMAVLDVVMSKAEEMILVVPRERFDALGDFQGINFEVDRYLPELLDRRNNHFMPRSAAEVDPKFKQIIPYVLLVHDNRVLHYVRSKKSGESRLHAKGSIGIGGHMNDHDEDLFNVDYDAYREGVRREVEEELELEGDYESRVVALINDDSDEVGQVHLGVVHLFRMTSDGVRPREAAISKPTFRSMEEVAELRESLESWSQICFDHLEEILRRAS